MTHKYAAVRFLRFLHHGLTVSSGVRPPLVSSHNAGGGESLSAGRATNITP